MTITAEQVYLLNRKMGRVASNVQLGTLLQNAESIVAAEIALAEGQVLVGNASGVAVATAMASGRILVGSASAKAVAVDVSGDVTLSASGVTAIAAGVIVNADVSGSAGITFAKMEALASGRLVVGSAGNVATAVDVTGDVTIGSTGVTAIGASKVTEAMLKVPSTVGLGVRRVAYCVFDPSAVAGDRTVAAHALAATIPDNAFVTGIWYWVETTFTSATDAGTVAISVEAANDVVTAIAISDGSNPWDSTAKPVEGTTKIETTSTWLYTTAARAITATVAVEALLLGKAHIWAEYVVHG